MYIIYNFPISDKVVNATIVTYSNDGEELNSSYMPVEWAKIKLEKIKTTLSVVKLPIDCDSDYYDKYLVSDTIKVSSILEYPENTSNDEIKSDAKPSFVDTLNDYLDIIKKDIKATTSIDADENTQKSNELLQDVMINITDYLKVFDKKF